jgi:hypothetical protein
MDANRHELSVVPDVLNANRKKSSVAPKLMDANWGKLSVVADVMAGTYECQPEGIFSGT